MPRKTKDDETLAAAPEPAPTADPNQSVAVRLAKGGQEAAQAVQEQRQADAQRKQEAVTAREQLLAKAAAGPEDRTENVLVAKTSARAAAQEQERIDAGKAAAAQQQPEPPPPPPPTEGTVPLEYHRSGQSGRDNPVLGQPTAGPMDEDVVYVTDDIAADGTPLTEHPNQAKKGPKVFVEPQPHIDGESDREYPQVDPDWKHAPAEPVDTGQPLINRASEAGAAVESFQRGQEVIFVPKESDLDPVSGKGTV